MEIFGRGMFYIIIGIAALLILSFLIRSTISISCVIAIPLIIIAFLIAVFRSGKRR